MKFGMVKRKALGTLRFSSLYEGDFVKKNGGRALPSFHNTRILSSVFRVDLRNLVWRIAGKGIIKEDGRDD